MELTKRLMSELEYSSELQKTLLKSYENNVYVTPKIALQPNPSTFSDILKKPSTASSSVLLIKADAVENADSKNIFQEITSSVNPANLNVCINSTKRIKNAKSGKPHTIGEKLILPAVEEVLKTVSHKPASDIIKRIPLRNNTVEKRIDEMSSDIESFLCNYLQTTHFSIPLDESTLPDNAALLLAYVRFIMNQEIYEELLFARTLITDTRDFESRFEDILTMVIPPWIIHPYGDIEETNVIIQEELTELSTNEELKVQFRNGYQQFWLQNNIPVTYPVS
ncbi:unnamed protein product [Acanthoscelides obtectus]|uniref:Uncharacterized protein n=1 Tax=Acanthoscelides obtectus TaxID=200917 RepID=A0A9P0KK35_ACAOB|nr:unnamed protein product [Acanthoscelides obtectus]CAK1642626.1 Zinc finger MYM-type protein 6 [Acanthoscelides obtectus]